MNILLDAYFDMNYGDDIFVKTITGMFPEYKFYTFLEYYSENIIRWAEEISNLYLLPECNVFLAKDMFDGYLCVGGDIFPDGGDFTKRKAAVRSVKRSGGTVAFLGFNMFRQYSETTQKEICDILSEADIIAPRDEQSAKLLRLWMPFKNISVMADLAFSYQWESRENVSPHRVGISIRKPLYANDDDMQNYVCGIAGFINKFLTDYEDGEVVLFNLSMGNEKDSVIAEEIIKMSGRYVREVSYDGNLNLVMSELLSCQVVLATRLHAMISCIALGIPFVPIVYEVKQTYILEEIGYTSNQFTFGDLHGLFEYVDKLLKEDVIGQYNRSTEMVSNYLEKSNVVLEQLRARLRSNSNSLIQKSDVLGPVCAEKEYGRLQAVAVTQKNEELNQLAEENLAGQKMIAECQSLIKMYLETIEKGNQENSRLFSVVEESNKQNEEYRQTIERINAQNEEYFRLIENLNAQNKAYIELIEKLNQEKQEYCELLEKKKNPFHFFR